MNYTVVNVGDFDLFSMTIKALAKLVPAAKFVINGNGYSIFSKNAFARIETYSSVLHTTNDSTVEFCINDLAKFNKVLASIKREFGEETIKINLKVTDKHISIESSKIKVKFITVREETIENYIVQTAVSTVLTPVFKFYTTSELIRNMNSNSFMFSDLDNIRIYLQGPQADMDNNVLYGKMASVNGNFSNEIISKLGYITFGKLADRQIIIDSERLSAFNLIDSDNIEISLMDKPFLVSKITKESESDVNKLKHSVNITVYLSIRKS
jgi:hypothetical protein